MQFDHSPEASQPVFTGKSLPREKGQALLRALDELPRPFRCPELLLARLYYEDRERDLVEKSALLDVVAEVVDRPYSQRVRFPKERREGEFQVSEAARTIADHLIDARVVFSKPNGSEFHHQACGGAGILRLELEETTLKVSVSEEVTLQRVLLGALPLFQAIGQRHFELDRTLALRLPFETFQDLPVLIESLHRNLRADRIVEDEIPICKFMGRPWAVRYILISECEEPNVVASYAKLGSNGLVSNISQGGSSKDARVVIDGIFEQQIPGIAQRERVYLRDKYLERAKAVAVQANIGLTHWFREALVSHYKDVGTVPLFVRSVAVDVTGVWNGELETLEPVVVEPNLAFAADGLREVSMRNYLRVLHRLEQVEARGYTVLDKLFG